MPKSKTLFYVSRLIYPNYHPIWFVIYMYFKYHSVVKRHIKYKLKVLSDGVLWNILKNYPRSNCDINNCVLIHSDNLYPSDKVLRLYHEDSGTSRKLIVIPETICNKNTLYVSHTYFYNDFIMKTDSDITLSKRGTNIEFAQEIELSLVSFPCDISNAIIDELIKNYFKLPKLICRKDVVSVNVKYFAEALFYCEPKLNSIENVYFKCNKVVFNGKEVDSEYFCVIGETSIKQGPNVQSFVPRVLMGPNKSVDFGVKSFSEVILRPRGMEEEFERLENAIYPFLSSKNLKLRPIFLVQGEEGCGDDILISALAKAEGMHHFRINNSDLSANVYAQNESKLNNVFFVAKMSAPCIVSIHKFENFGKNSEGQYDPRLINSFINYLDNLFDNNPHPIIVFCCSNSKNISPELKRVFLEIFEINAPTDTNREKILQWILDKNALNYNKVDLKLMANKTNGFYFEDLKALVYYAEKNTNNNNLDANDFEKALDYMQTNYNESLGAPKVPKVQWSDVGGLADVKDEIIKTINLPLKHPELFKNSGLTRSGILLFGPPGTGKTLLAKAVATECSLCFLTVKGPELLNMYVGQSEQNVREVFEKARQASPCIIFFDELDSLAPNRGLSGDSGGVMDRVVSQLLAEMDGLNSSGKVFIIGATNRPDLIDPALLRPGRFDKMLYVGPCTDLESKVSVLKALTRKFMLSKEVDLYAIVKNCPKNITGADFYGICSNAWSLAAKRLVESIEKGCNNGNEDVIVGVQDFAMAIKNVKLSISEQDLKYFENLKEELSSNNASNKNR